MKTFIKLNAIISVLLFSMLAPACGGNQIEDANELIEEANKYVNEANDLTKATEKKNKELFTTNIRTDAELKIYKEKMDATAKKIIADYTKSSELSANASRKFDEASKLNVPDKFKEYLETKSVEFAKRAEAVNIRKGNAQAFLDYDDPTMVKKFEDNNDKSEKLLNEAKQLGEQAIEIQIQHGEIFKS